MGSVAAELINAFPAALRGDAETPVRLLLRILEPLIYPPEDRDLIFSDVCVGDETVSLPYRLYDEGPTRIHYDDAQAHAFAVHAARGDLTTRQRLIYYCLLTRHHNGYVREDALCRIAAAREAFVVPFVAKLASEYVYEILLQIRLRMDEFDPCLYGAFFRDNPETFRLMHQRMISYWNAYYRWQDYVGADGDVHHRWRDRYIGFDIFDSFERMAKMGA